MDEKKIKEAYKVFYQSEWGRIILSDLADYAQINQPVYRAGTPDKIEDAIYMSAVQNVVHYLYGMCDTSLQKEIEDNVGRDEY